MPTETTRDPKERAVRAPARGARRALAPAAMVTVSLGALLALGLVGWLAWTEGALVGLRFVQFDSPLALAAPGLRRRHRRLLRAVRVRPVPRVRLVLSQRIQ